MRAGLVMRKVLVGLQCVLCTIPDVIVMKGHDCVIGSRAGLRMVVSTGTAAGATAGEEAAA